VNRTSAIDPHSRVATRRKPHVLFVLPNLQGGGAERVILTLLRHLDKNQFAVTLAVIDGRDSVFEGDLPDTVEFIDLKCTRVRYSISALIRLIWKRRPDVVFSVLGHLNLMLAVIKPFLPRSTKLISRETVVVSATLVGNYFSGAWRLAYRLFLPRCDAIVCQSHDMQNGLISDVGLSNDNLVVVQNPVDVERIGKLSRAAIPSALVGASSDDTSTRIQLVAAGRLVWQKGFDLLIEALAILGNPRFHVTIIGQGPLREELDRLAVKFGVASQVSLIGFQKNPYPFFKSADAFVLSSRFEGMPNVILEALACGTGVIAMPAPGGINEMLEGRPRCVVAKSVSARGLAEALEGYDFSMSRDRTPFQLDDYSVENVCARYGEVILSVVNRS
jgi:glycosyltransferase involved in cell wall biosynthesis